VVDDYYLFSAGRFLIAYTVPVVPRGFLFVKMMMGRLTL